MSNNRLWLPVIVLILVVAGIIFLLYRQLNQPPTGTSTTGQEVTKSGTITCLPKRGSGPQTLECAIGLQASDGNYYGLKNLYSVDQGYKYSQGGLSVEVRGKLTAERTGAPDGNTYDTAGTIEVTSIKEK